MSESVYECAICESVNHVIRRQCHTCGTIPARYSIISRPTKPESLTETVNAKGCVRASQHYRARFALATVPLDYYGDNE